MIKNSSHVMLCDSRSFDNRVIHVIFIKYNIQPMPSYSLIATLYMLLNVGENQITICKIGL